MSLDPAFRDEYSAGVAEIVDARDVLDTNARIKSEVTVTVLGHFERQGPNAWDDYRFLADGQGVLVVLPGIPIQLEAQGTEFRMRKEGRVIRVRWTPDNGEQPELQKRSAAEQRQYFTRTYLASHDEAAGVGTAAWIAGKLGG